MSLCSHIGPPHKMKLELGIPKLSKNSYSSNRSRLSTMIENDQQMIHPRWKNSWSTLIGRPINQSLQLICFVFDVFGITLAQRSAEVQWISHSHSMAKWFRCERITAGQNFKNCFRQDFRGDLQCWQTKANKEKRRYKQRLYIEPIVRVASWCCVLSGTNNVKKG